MKKASTLDHKNRKEKAPQNHHFRLGFAQKPFDSASKTFKISQISTIFVLFLLAASPSPAQTQSHLIATVLDDWHQAAAVADEPRYFSHFAPNGVFMGTDATERWTVAEFRAWAKPHFDRKAAWSFKPRDRHIDFSADGKTAWFDEMLDTPNLGVCRGSGVLLRLGNTWKIAQYNLSIAIPNALADRIVKEIANTR